MNKKTFTPIKIRTEEVRASYVRVFKPKFNTQSNKEEYSAMLLIDKNDKKTLTLIKEAVEKVCLEAFGNKSTADLKLRHPIKDPQKEENKKDHPAYKDKYYINTKNNSRPGVAEQQNGAIVRIENPDGFKSGDYCIASLTVRAFDVGVNKGVSVYLQNVLKTKDGESLAGATSPEDDFADMVTSTPEDSFLDDVPM
jgi:hypothetical protein